jgi:hypothetical protein
MAAPELRDNTIGSDFYAIRAAIRKSHAAEMPALAKACSDMRKIVARTHTVIAASKALMVEVDVELARSRIALVLAYQEAFAVVAGMQWPAHFTPKRGLKASYEIRDCDGHALVNVGRQEARQLAQKIANRLGESVWLCGSDNEREEIRTTAELPFIAWP